MRFAKVFDVDGTQLLCVLQPREEDGVPELKMITYVGDACITFGNRVAADDEALSDPAALLEQTRRLFDGFGQQQAEEAYRLAQRVVAEAREVREAAGAEQGDAEGSTLTAGDTDADFGVRLHSVALH